MALTRGGSEDLEVDSGESATEACNIEVFSDAMARSATVSCQGDVPWRPARRHILRFPQ